MSIDGLIEPRVGKVEAYVNAIIADKEKRALTAAQAKAKAKRRSKRKATKR
jgi:hypothetical protein